MNTTTTIQVKAEETMNRRQVLIAAAGFAGLGVTRNAVAQQSGRESDHPYLPNATFGDARLASNINTATLFTEPVTMIFFVYGLPDEDAARDAFTVTVEHTEQRADALTLRSGGDFDEVSIGPIGDQRWGYYRISKGDRARVLQAVVRVGANILSITGLALGGDTVEYVSEFLATFLDAATDAPESLVPDISDLPIGWELDTPVWADGVLDDLRDTDPPATPAMGLVASMLT